MAILGGAGNPVGGSFTGPAEAFEVIGNHGYAYSGAFAPQTSATTVLDFTTGNYYVVGQWQINQALAIADAGESSMYGQIKLNGNIVAQLLCGHSGADSMNTAIQDIIIPSYTQVEVIIRAGSSAEADILMMTTITGRIYRE